MDHNTNSSFTSEILANILQEYSKSFPQHKNKLLFEASNGIDKWRLVLVNTQKLDMYSGYYQHTYKIYLICVTLKDSAPEHIKQRFCDEHSKYCLLSFGNLTAPKTNNDICKYLPNRIKTIVNIINRAMVIINNMNLSCIQTNTMDEIVCTQHSTFEFTKR